MAKLLANQLCDRVTFQCIEMFGSYRYIEDYPIARMWRDSRLAQIDGETSEILCEIISKAIIDQKEIVPSRSNKEKEISEI